PRSDRTASFLLHWRSAKPRTRAPALEFRSDRRLESSPQLRTRRFAGLHPQLNQIWCAGRNGARQPSGKPASEFRYLTVRKPERHAAGYMLQFLDQADPETTVSAGQMKLGTPIESSDEIPHP